MAYKDNPENDDRNTVSLLGADVLSIAVIVVALTVFLAVIVVAVW